MLETYVRVWYDVIMWKQNSAKKESRITGSIRKADVILIVGCLMAALLIAIFFALHRVAGSRARISCDGLEVAVIAFGEPKQSEKFYLIRYTGTDATIERFDEYPLLPEEGNFNLLSVTDGRVSMAAADCRDQICVRHRPVSAGGESIICLPHRFVIEILGSEEGSMDHTDLPHNMQDGNPEENLDGMVK